MGAPTQPRRLPDSQRAIKVDDSNAVRVANDCALPQLFEGDVLVRVLYVGLNPVDSKSVDLSPTQDATVGCDFAGDVVQLGEGVSSDTFVVGSRVCGCVFGNNPIRPDNGAFAEYVAVPSALLLRIPDTLSHQEAATFGIGLATVGLALFHELGLPSRPSCPAPKAIPVLVSGGGTATGALAIQILRISGLDPIATCSPQNFERLKMLGASATFDYRSPTCGNDIREHTSNTLVFALDCHVDAGSMAICYDAIGPAGGKYMALNPFPLRGHRRRSVQPEWVFMFTQFSQPIPWKRPYNCDARPRDKAFAVEWYKELQKLLDQGKLIASRFREMKGGLEAIPNALDLVGKGQTNGYKLVFRVTSD